MTTPILAKNEVLERVDGDIQFLTDLTQDFLDSFPSQFAELSAAAESCDAHETEHKAHSLKGALRNLGGLKSGATAHKIELAAKQGDISTAKQMLSELKSDVKEFENEFKAFLSTV